MPVKKISISIDEDIFKRIDKVRGDVKRSTFITKFLREGLKRIA